LNIFFKLSPIEANVEEVESQILNFFK